MAYLNHQRDKQGLNKMKMTHLQAKEIFKTGDIEKAWEIAQQDEGLLPEITKEKWIEWMQKLIQKG